MNTYLIPTTAPYTYEPYNYIYMVCAESQEEAYNLAKEKLSGYCIPQKLQEYEFYSVELFDIPNDIFHESKKYDILYSLFISTKGFEYMAYFKVNWNKYTEQLMQIADQEIWSNSTYPNNGILSNYLVKTYDKLISEKKVIIGESYALFNTGLFTKYYEPIYAYQTGKEISFLTAYELGSIGVLERPERANYFEHPELLVFDWHFPIDIQFDHILDDEKNKLRLPDGFLNKENKVCILTGAIELMKKRISANYKLAIPQYYDGKIQLLLPLCLDTDDGIPNLALAVTKKETCYQGHTCLTLDMAYNNARLIAKPENNWLTQ